MCMLYIHSYTSSEKFEVFDQYNFFLLIFFIGYRKHKFALQERIFVYLKYISYAFNRFKKTASLTKKFSMINCDLVIKV